MKNLKLLVLVIPLFVGYCEYQMSGTFIGIAIYGTMSTVASIFNLIDKKRAMNERSRVPEKYLHLLEFLGGWPGALFIQQLIRHKTQKKSYAVIQVLIILLHCSAAVFGIWYCYTKGELTWN